MQNLIRTPYWQYSIINKYNIKIAFLYFFIPFIAIIILLQFKFPNIFIEDKNLVLIIFIIFAAITSLLTLPKSFWYNDARQVNIAPNPCFYFLKINGENAIINDPMLGILKFKKKYPLNNINIEISGEKAIIKIKNQKLIYDVNHLAYENGELLSGLDWPSNNKDFDLKNNIWSNMLSKNPENIIHKQKEQKKLMLSLLWPF